MASITCFGHVQLYVPMSRVCDPDNITITMKLTINLPANSTRNVVFKDVLMAYDSGAQQDVTSLLQNTPTASALQFDDLDKDWPPINDYDIIENVIDNGYIMEELGTPTKCRWIVWSLNITN